MSAPATRAQTRARRAAEARGTFAMVMDGVFFVAIAALGIVAAWPIYRDVWMLLTATVALALGIGIAALSARRGWPWWLVALTTLGAYIVAGVPLAVPSALSDIAQVPGALLQLVTAPVTGWKNLLTLELPLGSYQATLAPLLLLFLVIPVAALSLAWRGKRAWVLAVPVALVLPVFGLVFGSSAVRGVLQSGPIVIAGTVELLTGIGAVLVALAWYVWRAASQRSRAVQTALKASGVQVRRHPGAAATRWLMGAGMALAAVVIGALVAPMALAESPRDVLRTSIEPELKLRTELSPLTLYREFYSDDMFDEVLFTVSSDAERVRLATLSFYDGIVARVTDPSSTTDASQNAFVRVPSSISDARSVSADIEIGALQGIWLPTVGSLTSIRFEGPDRAALADGFYYSSSADMGIELSEQGIAPGDTYSQTAGSETDASDVATLTPADTRSRIDPDVIPESLIDWIDAQDAGSGGSALATLIERLRARGYLSHAISMPQDAAPAWVAELGDYAFEPSRAGHSTDRIDELFLTLLERQNDVGGDNDELLVAAPGDDEQFAVAASLVAAQLGFPSRVVLGARLAPSAQDAAAPPVCEDGQCRGGDISAWIEVQTNDGAWVPIDTTPQHEIQISPDVDERSDPQNPTEVEPEQADVVPPPDATPADGAGSSDDVVVDTTDLSGLWAALRIAGVSLIVLLVLVGPFLAVIIAKVLRRRSRRGSPDPVDRVVGGWDEFVDAAVDAGLPAPRTQTRHELASVYDEESAGSGTLLATWADRSVFSPTATSDSDTDAFWALVDAERERIASTQSFWSRLRARVSLRSLRRSVRELGTVRSRPSIPRR